MICEDWLLQESLKETLFEGDVFLDMFIYIYMNFICDVHRHVQIYRTQHTCDVYNIAVERIDVYSVI